MSNISALNFELVLYCVNKKLVYYKIITNKIVLNGFFHRLTKEEKRLIKEEEKKQKEQKKLELQREKERKKKEEIRMKNRQKTIKQFKVL